MDLLPLELQTCITSYLSKNDLAALSRCSKWLYDLAAPLLYHDLNITLYYGDIDFRAMKLLKILAHQSHLQRLIRNITLESEECHGWTRCHSSLLHILLSTILKSSSCIYSFSWNLSYVYTGVLFPRLQTLECQKIQLVKEVQWIAWHIENCSSLSSLSLSLSPSNYFLGGAICEAINKRCCNPLRYLYLEGINVTSLSTSKLRCLVSFEIKLCPGSESLLQRLTKNHSRSPLESLRITGTTNIDTIEGYLDSIARTGCLKELMLRLGGCERLLESRHVAAHSDHLKILVIECRQRLEDPSSTIKFTLQHFGSLVSQCKCLESLGIAIDLRDPFRSSSRYRRSKSIVSPNCVS